MTTTLTDDLSDLRVQLRDTWRALPNPPLPSAVRDLLLTDLRVKDDWQLLDEVGANFAIKFYTVAIRIARRAG